MIDWLAAIATGLWVAGLALFLAVFGYSYTTRRTQSPGEILFDVLGQPWTMLGGALFGVGMALTASSPVESVLWLLLILGPVYGWLLARQRPRSAPPATAPKLPAPDSSLARAADWIVKSELIWLALLAPFLLFPAPGRAFVVAGLPLLWLARFVARRRFVPSTPLDWPILLLLVMVLVSLFATPAISLSLSKISGLLFGVAVYYALVEWAGAGRRIEVLLAGLLLAGLGLALLGLVGTNWTNKFAVLATYINKLPAIIRGLPGAEDGIQSNELAGSLLYVLPLQLLIWGWALFSPVRNRAMLWLLRVGLALAILFTLGVLVLTQSRGALAGLALGLAVAVVLAFRAARIAVAGLVVVAVAAVLVIGPGTLADRLYAADARINSAYDINSIGGRLQIWSRAVYGIEDFPYTGMGMNTFRTLMPILYPTESSEADARDTQDIAHAHNQFLQAALDLGLPGLVAFFALWFAAAGLVVQAAQWATDRLSRAAAWGIAAVLGASLAFGMTDAVSLGARPGALFWANLALLVCLWQRARESRWLGEGLAGAADLMGEDAEDFGQSIPQRAEPLQAH